MRTILACNRKIEIITLLELDSCEKFYTSSMYWYVWGKQEVHMKLFVGKIKVRDHFTETGLH